MLPTSSTKERGSAFPHEFRSNPYEVYDALRPHTPLYWTGGDQPMWLVMRYSDSTSILRDSRFGRDLSVSTWLTALRADRRDVDEVLGGLANAMLFADPPGHTRLRRLVAKAIAEPPHRQRERVLRRIGSRLQQLAGTEVFDVVNDYAYPIAFGVVADLMGVPVADRPAVISLVHDLVDISESVVDPGIVDKVVTARKSLSEFLRCLVLEKCRTPSEDAISRLIEVEHGSDALTEDEVVASASLLLGAGFETIVGGIANATLLLLSHEPERRAMRAEPHLLPSAVDELLRCESPVQLSARITREPVELSGRLVPRGELVVVFIGAANRDPMQFAKPAEIDVGRPNAGTHLAFGAGAHACLGAAQARFEIGEALRALFGQFPEMQLVDQRVPYKSGLTLRAPEELRVRA